MRILYKYACPARVDVLRERRIRFTNPTAFNDPFECRPYFRSVLEPGVLDEVCDLRDPVSNLRDEAATRRFKETMTGILESSESRDWAQRGKSQNLVLLSLAERPDNLLMWAHYAQQHEGFVFGFDIEHPSLANRKDGVRRYVSNVTYARERPARTALIDLSVEQFLATKNNDWTYEQEWRLFDGVVNADATSADGRVLLFNVSPAAVRQVIIGCRAATSTEDAVREVLNQADYEHVRLERVVPDEKEYRLNLQPA